jgi:phosphatidylserine/phosphatidylglycerophosphate/cardiolipin synthase-like enzyme
MNFNDIYSGVNQSVLSGDVEIHFDNIEKHIIDIIGGSTIFVGCAYNFSNTNIINALSKDNGKQACIILDKSEFHKSNNTNIFDTLAAFEFDLRELGEGLFDKNMFYATSFLPTKTNKTSVRVFGGVASYAKQNKDNEKVKKGIADKNTKADFKFPLLHHKFFVCCDKNEHGKLTFNCVITGSFNFSKNAPVCKENIVVIKNEAVVRGFYEEWRRCFIFSENLTNYDHEKMTPEHIGDENFQALLNRLIDEDNDIIEHEADKYEYLNDHKNGAFDKIHG